MTPVTVVLPAPPSVRVRPVAEPSDKAMVPMLSVTVVWLLVRVLFWALLRRAVIVVVPVPAIVKMRAAVAPDSARFKEGINSAAGEVRLFVRVRSPPNLRGGGDRTDLALALLRFDASEAQSQ